MAIVLKYGQSRPLHGLDGQQFGVPGAAGLGMNLIDASAKVERIVRPCYALISRRRWIELKSAGHLRVPRPLRSTVGTVRHPCKWKNFASQGMANVVGHRVAIESLTPAARSATMHF